MHLRTEEGAYGSILTKIYVNLNFCPNLRIFIGTLWLCCREKTPNIDEHFIIYYKCKAICTFPYNFLENISLCKPCLNEKIILQFGAVIMQFYR